jgi:hypothetical protein
MKIFVITCALLISTSSLLAQEYQVKVLGRQNIDEHTFLQICELKIYNNTKHQIGIKVSPTFALRILSRDTIRLATFRTEESDCLFFRLSHSQEDVDNGFNDLRSYPLILNSRTCFVATVSLVRKVSCDSCAIEYSYFGEPDRDYQQLIEFYKKHIPWENSKIKVFTRRMIVPQ